MNTMPHAGKKREFAIRVKPVQGFTMIELMIVAAIIAIIAAIAFANYGPYVTRTRRTEAQGCMQEAAQYMERFYTTNLRYDQTAAGAAVALPACTRAQSITPFYTVALAAGTTATAYSITAVPKSPQDVNDAKCGTLAIDQAGAQTITGSGPREDCW